MAGGKRSDRLSTRDVEVLGFVARFGLVPREAVSIWAGTARSVTLARERRLRRAGMIEVGSEFWGAERMVVPTAAGLRLSGYRRLGPARISGSVVAHESAVARLAARLEVAGVRLLSEREALAHERAEERRVYSLKMEDGRRLHRCDLIALPGDGGAPAAIEVELSVKGAARLDRILRSWRRAIAAGRFADVSYYCSPQAIGGVQRAVERTATGSYVRVVEL
ncbi:MAG: hypothetical protein AB7V58_17160 [Solirubrobacterales bacterium]